MVFFYTQDFFVDETIPKPVLFKRIMHLLNFLNQESNSLTSSNTGRTNSILKISSSETKITNI